MENKATLLVSYFFVLFKLGNALENVTARPFYNDLTKLIDETLNSNSTDDYDRLKNAISLSSDVFYETDLSLRKFERILPVINLIQRLDQNGMQPKLMLSLKYVNSTSGKFLEGRLSDVFHSIEDKLYPNDKEKIATYLAAIVLDFTTERPDIPSFLKAADYLQDYNFITTVKDLVRFYFGHQKIPVGIVYSWGSIDRNKRYYDFIQFWEEQASQADFLIISINLYRDMQYPLSEDKFKTMIDENLNGNRQKLEETLLKGTNMTVTVLIKLIGDCKPNPNKIGFSFSNNWKLSEKALAATISYNKSYHSLLKQTYTESIQLFKDIVGSLALELNQNMIISNPCHNYSSTPTFKKGLMKPYLQLKPGLIDACELDKNLTFLMNRFESIVVDEKTWMRIASYQESVNPNKSCVSYSSSYPVDSIVSFKYLIDRHWSNIESSVFEMLRSKTTIGAMRLTTLLFHEVDVRRSDQIVKFIETVSHRHISVGCSIDLNYFMESFREFRNRPREITPELFKKWSKQRLCNSVFDFVDTFVWRVRYDYDMFFEKGLFTGYSSAFLAREIFLAEFPGKKVFVEFDTRFDKQIISQLYNVPVISPIEQITFSNFTLRM